MCCHYPFGPEKKITKDIRIDMKNRITELFSRKQHNILSVFFTAGFPSLNDTVAIGKHLAAAGADMIEVGIPFSDPIADGPTIQESNKTALTNGMTLKLLLRQVKELRSEINIPIVLMGYLNPVLQYGFEKFCADASAAGADGLILPDLPLDEFERDYKSLTDSLNLSVSFLISPTTSEVRIRKINNLSSGFIYAVSASSTTGAKDQFSDEQIAYFKRLASLKLRNPFLVGFGVSNSITFRQVCQHAAGAIVGSSFITMLRNSTRLEADIPSFIQSIRNTE
jgi:tryptophan synthase alpha chain